MTTVSDVFGDKGLLAQEFTHFRQRDGQMELARAVGEAFAKQTTLIAEAGTGIGKSFAYLVPAILSGQKVVISTATKTLQDQLYNKDLQSLSRALKPVLSAHPNAMVLKGRANYVCHFHLERNLSEGRFPDPTTGGKLRTVREFANQSDTGDKGAFNKLPEDDEAWGFAVSTRDNCLGQECPNLNQCFVMKARRRAMSADIVIVNHHLFSADLALRDEGVAELLPTAQAVIFDEAHQLPAICSQFMGQSVSARAVQQALRDVFSACATEAPEAQAQLRPMLEIEQRLREVRLEWPDAQGRASPKKSARELLAREEFTEALHALADDLALLKSQTSALAIRGPMLEKAALRASELHYLLRTWLADDEEDEPMVRWGEAFQRGWALHSTPLDIGPIIQRQLMSAPKALIFLSATLSMDGDFRHFIRRLGIEPDEALALASPFNYPDQARLWIPQGLPEPASSDFLSSLLAKTWPLIKDNGGRAFLLCTSLRSVAAIGRWCRDDLSRIKGIDLLVQGEQPRARLLELFRKSNSPVLVGSASFWEGVDVVGDQLSIVLIDKLPFAPPDDPVLQARMEAARRKGENPFNDYQVPEAAMMLKQGAGRLIRSETDKGVLILGDPRLTSRGYGRQLLKSLPPFPLEREFEAVSGFLHKKLLT